MFSSPQLDSPPPPRTLHYHRLRPWSPDQHGLVSQLNSGSDNPYSTSASLTRQREASEASIEALDLADYARTLRTGQPEDNFSKHQYGTPQDGSLSYPLASFAPEVRTSRDSLSPPSLVSRGATLSSSNHSASRRPFSLPTLALSNHTLYSHQPHIFEPRPIHPGEHSPKIDISQFPAWSRSWYQSSNKANTHSPPPIDNFYTAIPPSHFNPVKTQNKRSVFDPDYTHYDQDYYPGAEPSSLSDPVFAPPSSMGHDSPRVLLPWSHSDNTASVDPLTKEERMRMLEREFGPNSGRGKDRFSEDFVDEEGKPLIGTVNEKGYLVTQGPRKRVVLRVLQILLALGSGIPAIYAALVIKTNPPAPPAGTLPAIVLYVLSTITFLLLLYLYLFRPCCCSPRRKDKNLIGNPLAGGMMVLPVPNSGNSKKNKGKKSKKGRGDNRAIGEGGDVQVNLIVDPHVFTGGRDDEDTDDEESDAIPGGYYGVGGDDLRSKAKRRRNKRRSVFAGLAMEAEWKRARSWTKKLTIVDAAGVIIWGAVFVIVLIGKRCPSGGFDGWCNAYNISSACACLLCIAFGVGVFFGVKDLHTSKVSPRTRT